MQYNIDRKEKSKILLSGIMNSDRNHNMNENNKEKP